MATAIPLLRAPILAGVTHAFTTRRGGVSDGPFATLNLGRGAGDDPACVAENRRRALAALGVDLAGHVEATQVHGTAVAVVTRADAGTAVEGADGLLTADAAVTLAVHAADCVPILLWDPRRGAVGAVHAGWRGTAAGIGGAAVAASATFDGGANQIVLIPRVALADGEYVVTVTPVVTDAAGNALATAYTLRFTTGAPASEQRIYLPIVKR